MLDDVTKKRINTLRQILVGKLPDPKAQVEQITNGLIYKFMNDMDEESISMGGKSTYFSGKYQKYSWKNLLDTKTSGIEKLSLYSEAIEQMYNNENLPELFREIFKNSFLPFKDPSTLNMFLKEINEFHYSNSEKLGDAFEYLLSFMGSQGDAGQFRTPRHIIDFIVEIVNPQKNETILDPACGTAGFLISSYKHILKQNTKKNLGDGLTASDRKKIGENLNGYDISPDMVKMSLVNMYLHKFTNPKISEYDTLSSEDKWNEYYDVILANPPFFSPKGGIMPHNRFGVKSTKAEVLFIDYINEHLKPNGRAGIIVPEGVIFQTGTAYKQLRKKLVETSLIGVVSLPAGVFQPYSGVKTSVLILDKKKSKNTEKIFFQKINNDGFSLSSIRTPITGNDLPKIIKNFREFNNTEAFIDKEKLLNSSDYSFLFERYSESKRSEKTSKLIQIGEYFKILNGSTPSRKVKKYWDDGNIPWFTIDDIRRQGRVITNTSQHITKDALKETSVKLVPKLSTLICCTASVGEVAFNDIELTTNQQFNALIIKDEFKEEINPKYIFWISSSLKEEIKRIAGSTSFEYLSVTNLKKIKIPLPSKETQNQIVEELDGYQKIIDGCRQVIENYKPSIDIDPSWEEVELGELCKIYTGKLNANAAVENGKYPFFTCSKEIFKIDSYAYNCECLLLSGNNASGNYDVKYYEGKFNAYQRTYIIEIRKNYLKKINYQILKSIIENQLSKLKNLSSGSLTKYLTLPVVKSIKTYLLPEELIKEKTEILSKEIQTIENNKELIKNISNKIQNKINILWSN